ncbi:MAG TPA: NAD(P)/FAD-dependent oxidoreductase [Patescibacteria group bacterium]|nr:NAD(P)/FAD-dependent oxidoreductase [Patescibacteria group bacterium]
MSDQGEMDVLVVGAGPVGLTAALFLKRQGVRVTIVDQVHRTNQHSYALVLHPQTLDLLEEAGLAPAVMARARELTRIAFYEGAQRKAEIDLAAAGGAHPMVRMMRLSHLEREIEEILRRAGLSVHWNHRLQVLRQDGDRVVAEVAELDQVAAGYPIARTEWVVMKTRTYRPRFVIGADGWDSTVRRLAGIDTETKGTGQIVSVYEADVEGELPAEGRMVLDAARTSVYWPLEPGRCRWAFEVAAPEEHDPSLERMRKLLAERAPWFTAKPTYIYWSSLARFDRRAAREFGRGGVVLAGDAAHLGTPAGARSMNLGLAEARALAVRIADVIRHGAANDAVLQEAAAERDRWVRSRITSARPTADAWVARNADRIIDCLPVSGAGLEPALGQIGLTLEAGT